MKLSVATSIFATMVHSAYGNDLLQLGRFEIRHMNPLGSASITDDDLSVSVNVYVGSSINDLNLLSIEVYGMMDDSIAASSKCDDGEEITSITEEAKAINGGEGSYSFNLDLANVASDEMATDGKEVDVCARITYKDDSNGIETYRDTRFVIDRTYTAAMTGVGVAIRDPDTEQVSKAEVTDVEITSFFCNTDKEDIGTQSFVQGQDIRICVAPDEADGLFEYTVRDFTNVECGNISVQPQDLGNLYAYEKDETPLDDGTLGFTFLLSEQFLENFVGAPSSIQCSGTVLLDYTRKGGSSSKFCSTFYVGVCSDADGNVPQNFNFLGIAGSLEGCLELCGEQETATACEYLDYYTECFSYESTIAGGTIAGGDGWDMAECYPTTANGCPDSATRALKAVAPFGDTQERYLQENNLVEAPFTMEINIVEDDSGSSVAGRPLATFGAAAALVALL